MESRARSSRVPSLRTSGADTSHATAHARLPGRLAGPALPRLEVSHLVVYFIHNLVIGLFGKNYFSIVSC